MDRLIDGVRRFRRDVYKDKRNLFTRLARGQSPRILFITCSDSRINPHLLTGSEPGELFVMRNAGNLIPAYGASASGEEGTLEYAVSALKVEHIIVCGHSSCGAMTGLLRPETLADVPSVARWLGHARATLQVVDALFGTRLPLEERLARTIEINALRQLDNLRSHPAVAAALAACRVSLHAWVYDIRSGAVRSYDEKQRTFVELNDALHPVGDYLTLIAAG